MSLSVVALTLGCAAPKPEDPPPAPVPASRPPAKVETPAEPTDPPLQIEAGLDHVCARLRSGRVACWGSNARGELGDGTHLPSDDPVFVVGLAGATSLMRGGLCAQTDDGVVCWGEAGTSCDTCPALPSSPVRRMHATNLGFQVYEPKNVCGLDADGVHCADQPDAQPPRPLATLLEGQRSICGLDAAGTVLCRWRDGDQWWPPSLPPAKAVGLGPFHLCVAGEDQRVHCWGDRRRSGYAEVEPSWPPNKYGPERVIEGRKATAIGAGVRQTCVVTPAGTVECWGKAKRTTAVVRSGPALQGALQVAVARDRACALDEQAQVRCWALDEGPDTATVVDLSPVAHEPVSDADGLRARLRAADSERAVAALSDLEAGVVFARGREGRLLRPDTACFAEQLPPARLGLRPDGAWSCDPDLRRCTLRDDAGETRFEFEQGRLRAVIDLDDAAAFTDAAVQAAVTDARDHQNCDLWQRLQRRDEALLGPSLTVLRHRDTIFGDEARPGIRHLCGDEARRAARRMMAVESPMDGARCDGLRCTVGADHGAQEVRVFRADETGALRLWIVGLDSPEGSLLARAEARAAEHRCP